MRLHPVWRRDYSSQSSYTWINTVKSVKIVKILKMCTSRDGNGVWEDNVEDRQSEGFQATSLHQSADQVHS